MNVKILGLDSMREFTADSVVIPTVQGSYTILEGHAPYRTVLATNSVVTIRTVGGAVKSVTLAGGIVEIDRHSVLILLIGDKA